MRVSSDVRRPHWVSKCGLTLFPYRVRGYLKFSTFFRRFRIFDFPGKGPGPGFSLCSVPFLLGVVFSGVGGFPLDKNHAQNIFSRENKSQITKTRCSKIRFPRPKSLWIIEISKNAKVFKNRSSKLQIIEKNSGPRTTCFLDPGATSALEIGDEKRVTKRQIGRNFLTTIFLDKNAGTHDFGSRKKRYARFWLEKNKA